MGHRYAIKGLCAALWLTVASAPGFARAQTYPPAVQRYLSNGADMTRVPGPGQPGAEYFSNGADATSVPKRGQPGGQYFSRGADATTAQPGSPAEALQSRGAEVMSAQRGTLAGEYFSNGAQLTHVPTRGQPGAEYFSQGAEATNVDRWFAAPVPTAKEEPVPQEPIEEQSVEQGSAEQGVEAESADSEQATPATQADNDQRGMTAGATTTARADTDPAAQRTPATLHDVDSRARRTREDVRHASTSDQSRASGSSVVQPMIDLLASYTLASMITAVTALLLALFVALGLRAHARR